MTEGNIKIGKGRSNRPMAVSLKMAMPTISTLSFALIFRGLWNCTGMPSDPVLYIFVYFFGSTFAGTIIAVLVFGPIVGGSIYDDLKRDCIIFFHMLLGLFELALLSHWLMPADFLAKLMRMSG